MTKLRNLKDLVIHGFKRNKQRHAFVAVERYVQR